MAFCAWLWKLSLSHPLRFARYFKLAVQLSLPRWPLIRATVFDFCSLAGIVQMICRFAKMQGSSCLLRFLNMPSSYCQFVGLKRDFSSLLRRLTWVMSHFEHQLIKIADVGGLYCLPLCWSLQKIVLARVWFSDWIDLALRSNFHRPRCYPAWNYHLTS